MARGQGPQACPAQASRHFAHIHVDLVGLLPPSRGHTYLFTAIPLSSVTAADCAKALFAPAQAEISPVIV
jgi:hypothetical protein